MAYDRPATAFNDWRRPPGVLTVGVDDPEGIFGTVYVDLNREQAESLLENLRVSLAAIDEPRLTPEERLGVM
jgi:hypothetical protein